MPSWKKVIVSGSDASFASIYTSSHITGSANISSSLASTGSFGSVQATTLSVDGTLSVNGLSVDGKFTEGGYSITALMEQMVVWDQSSDGSEDVTILNFVPIITEDGESIVS